MTPDSHERHGLRDISGYVPGEQPAGGVKLNTNENPYPPPPAIAGAIARFPIERLRRYPSAAADPFRVAAARLHGVDPNEIVATNGGDELLRLALATYVDPGESVAIAPPTYSLYKVLIRIHGARPVELPLTDRWEMSDGFAASLNRSRARLAFLVNPHAPSGTALRPGSRRGDRVRVRGRAPRGRSVRRLRRSRAWIRPRARDPLASETCSSFAP